MGRRVNERILIIKMGALGDVILASPHIARIVEHHPGEVWLLTAPAFVSLFAGHTRLKLVAFPRKGARAMWSALRWIRQQDFAAVYDLQGSDRSRALTFLSGAARRIGFAPRWLYTHSPPDDDIHEHVFVRLNRLLTCAGVNAAPATPQFWVEAAVKERIRHWLQQQGLAAGTFVLMHAGSSQRWPSKRWPQGHFADLARRLQAHDLSVLWIGGQDDVTVNKALATQYGQDVSGRFSIPELAELARSARFAVVNDSGPMHVLSTAGIPVYAFFGPTDWRRSHALGQGERILTHTVACSPCHLPHCPPAKQHACLDALTPAQVWARLQADGLLESILK